jgi:hypothetical protein
MEPTTQESLMRHCKHLLPKHAAACAFALAISISSGARAEITIDGTEYPAGTAIDNEFASLGVLFSSELGYVTFATDDFPGIFGTMAGSMWVGIAGASFSAPITATFVDPMDSNVAAIVNGTISARFGDGGGDLDSLRLRAFNVDDQLIDTVVSQAIDFGNISLTGVGIHRVVFDQNPGGSLTTNTALDYLTFPNPIPAPEPSALAVSLFLGFASIGRCRPIRAKC